MLVYSVLSLQTVLCPTDPLPGYNKKIRIEERRSTDGKAD